jgi:hypothetical protein
MAIMLRRQLNDGEKAIILQRFGRICFSNGHVIPDGEVVHFDHIRAFASGGQTELDNIGPMCEIHNKAKGSLVLEDFRVRLRLQEFFSEGESLTLKHLLCHLKDNQDITNYGQAVIVHDNDRWCVLTAAMPITSIRSTLVPLLNGSISMRHSR